jgi:hypothetical protein
LARKHVLEDAEVEAWLESRRIATPARSEQAAT